LNLAILIPAFVIAGYVLGSVPFGLFVGKFKGIDVRTAGSGNIGATNVGRLLGRKFGGLVLVLDALKGWVPTYTAGAMLQDRIEPSPALYLAWLGVGLACVLGHNFPIYLNFKGGKGVATSLGVVLGVHYFLYPGLIAFGVWIILVVLTKYVSAGSIAAAVTMPVAYVAIALKQQWQPFGNQLPLTLFAALVAGLIIFRHRANIQRLLAGTENPIGKKKPS
jgi:glycerol-3-phosphate acyltransferase PlsY